MKKTLIFASAFALALTVAPFAFADVTVDPCAGSSFSILCNASLSGAFSGLITAAFVIAILVALAYLIYGGIRWILSQGDKTKVDSARSHIIAAIIGLIVIFLAYFMLNIITQLFFHQNINSLTNIPQINLSGVPTCDLWNPASKAIDPANANITCVNQGKGLVPTVTYTTCVLNNPNTPVTDAISGEGYCQ